MSETEIKRREGKLKASLRWWKKLGKKEQEQLARKYRARWIPDHWIMVTKSTSTIRDIYEKEMQVIRLEHMMGNELDKVTKVAKELASHYSNGYSKMYKSGKVVMEITSERFADFCMLQYFLEELKELKGLIIKVEEGK